MTNFAAAVAVAALAAGPCDPPASLWQKTLNILGIPANPGTRGTKKPPPAGDLYRVPAGGGARIRVTEGGGYRSPILAPDDEHVLALWRGRLVRVATDRGVVTGPEWLMDLPDAVRLAGLSEADPDLLVVLLEKAGRRYPAVVCLGSRRLADFAGAKKDLGKLLKRLRGTERHYGDVVVTSVKNAAGGRDVALRTGAEKVAVSKCGGDTCTQGALSGDRRRVVFVRAPRG